MLLDIQIVTKIINSYQKNTENTYTRKSVFSIFIATEPLKLISNIYIYK